MTKSNLSREASPDTNRHTPVSMVSTPTIDERANFCFGCGPDNPQGLHLSFVIDSADHENITATAKVQRITRGTARTDTLMESAIAGIHGKK